MAIKVKITWEKGRGGRKQTGTAEIKVKCGKADDKRIRQEVHSWSRNQANRGKTVTGFKVA